MAPMTMLARQKLRMRSTQTKFDESQLYGEWSVMVLHSRSTEALWNGSDYSKTRSGGPDRDQLQKAAPKLLPLAKLGRNGYLCHISLRRVLEKLHDDFKVLDDCKPGTSQEKVIELASVPTSQKANHAADAWRCMLKHVAQLKLNRKVPLHAGLKEVYDNLTDVTQREVAAARDEEAERIPAVVTTAGSPVASSVPLNASGFADFTELFVGGQDEIDGSDADADDDGRASDDDDTLDCEVMAMRCACGLCKGDGVHDLLGGSDAESCDSKTSQLAMAAPVPSAKKGGQKVDSSIPKQKKVS